MIIDTHAHLNFNVFKDDVDQVIRRSLDKGLWIINVGSQYSTSKRAVEIAENYDKGVYAAIGLHPINLETDLVKIKVDPKEIQFQPKEKDFDYKKYKELAQSPKVVAIGEIGLDYYWKPKTKARLNLFKEKQKELLLKQLEMARELNLPVIFHSRMAHKDLAEVLKSQTQNEGVMHSFVGTPEQLQEYLKMGFYIGFNGIIFKTIQGIDFKENIKNAPLEKILIETDCPYLTPPQMEGRNEPLYVKYVAQRIAEIKSISYEKVIEATSQNAKDLFGI
ncbi:MAG: hydrolase TatD [Parcubacteria group bacterium]|nr:hydrolase TatD [Parcubacteria group bacterium]|tara:strand:+ start:9258 stop:10088 length:831 start_codon:yes stop_codon:yes gene_type:complete